LSFERFKRWRLRIPGTVKLWESPGKAGGLPVIIKINPVSQIVSSIKHYNEHTIPVN